MIIDVAPGLWLWRIDHPDWDGEEDWEPAVTCVCVESGGEVIAIDPLDDPEALARLDTKPPTAVLILKPDHIRDVDAFVRRYGAKAYGPMLFWRGEVPETELEPIHPGERELPGGLVALYDPRARAETPLYLPEQRALVFADAMTAPGGELRIWKTGYHEERVLPGFRHFLELPFEHVIVSHGEPLHDRAAFERALTLPPYSEPEGT